MDGNSENTVVLTGAGEAPSAAANATTVDAPVIEKITVDTPVDPIIAANNAAAEAAAASAEAATEAVYSSAAEAEPASAMAIQSAQDYFANAFSVGMQGQDNPEAAGETANAGTSGEWQPYSTVYSSPAEGKADSGVFDYYGYNSGSSYGQNPNYGQNGEYSQTTAYGGTTNYGYAGGADYGQSTPYGQTAGYAANGNGTPGYLQSGTGQGNGYMYGATDEYSQPSYGFQAAYGNDPFATYYDDDEPRRPSNGLAIGALVCGIVSLASSCSYLGFIPGIVAIILGAKGTKESGNPKMATIGLILGILGTVIGLIVAFGMLANIAAEFSELF